MSERVRRLREQSVNSKPYISTERAELLTQFYQSDASYMVSSPVGRASAFGYLLENKTISINEGELIVGERGTAPKATPTYPELCCHTLEDLEMLNSRKTTPFLVSEDTKKIYREKIIPLWKGKNMRERVFSAMSEEWTNAFNSGVFTEFMEQRAPGHAVLDDTIYHKGLLGFKEEIKNKLNNLDYFGDPDAYSKEQELKAMQIAADALIIFAERHAEKARELGEVEKNPRRKKELRKITDVCSHVPAHPPRDFWEALQMYWFIHIGVITELNVWDSFSPGRLDQHLYPFYKKDLTEGKMTKEFAKELLECFWIKFNNQPAPPKVDITQEQSGTYQDFALINVGGLKEDGSDGVNELSYLILDVLEEMRLIQPSVCIQLSSKNPHRFLKRALEVVKTGFGQPSIFNTDVIIQEFLRAGKSMKDARAGGPSGCVTISAFGKESCTLTGYCNWPKIFELTLNNGIDSQNAKQIGLQTGDPSSFTSFDELMTAYKKQLRYFVDLKVKGNNIIERLYANYMPAPFMSLLFDDCIAKAKDYHDGGPRYNSTYIQGVGIGTLTDSLSAVKHHVFDTKKLTMKELLDMLKNNFDGSQKIQRMLLNETPKYGNDDDYADSIAWSIFEEYFDVVDGRPNTKGGEYRVNLLPTTVHIYFGRVTGATPDGRKAGEPLSDGISPSQGADKNGPTAVIKSAAKIDHTKTGGTLLNQKLMPQLLADEEGIDKLAHLVRTYFRLGGHHIQFNVVDAETLREAQKNPEKYRDLIIRVAGYSDYFVDLDKELQDEIIARTEHRNF
ncbi:MAG: glycyl radical protein [Candidatus Bathyarchaeota archaeon]|nr:glycyl radical protein [Candidatus Bathyarchaeota archaeon]MDH5745572.1 glycyl radical protein [Candidatus Bathyarchaeota archaeon]